jgi:Ca2+-binding EF-hand superfamily protein
MGNSKSSLVTNKYVNVYATEHRVQRWRSRFELLQLKENEIGMLYEIFQQCDISKRNKVNTRHLTTYCKMEKVPFTNRMLATFKKGQNFAGFVFELWDICTTDEGNLGKGF